jgi:glycosyltransferase involved in cell wall biosynthesis
VVIDTYNYAEYLPQAIESALDQDHTDVEVIVVDDGSTDGTPDVVARYDGRVTALRTPQPWPAGGVRDGLRRQPRGDGGVPRRR